MLPKIGKPFLYLSSAKEVWDAVSQTYSKKGNTTQIYELKTMIHNTKQKNLTITTYHNTLKILWQELDLHQHFEMESTADASMLVKLFQRDRVFDFLAGLKPELDEVRSRVLGKEPLPCLSEVYSYVHSEESRRSDVLVPGSQENSTLKVAQDNTHIGPMGHGKKGLEKKIIDSVIIAINQDTRKKHVGS